MSPSLGNLLNQTQFKVAEFSPLREGEVVVAVVGKNNDWLFTGPNEDPSWQQTEPGREGGEGGHGDGAAHPRQAGAHTAGPVCLTAE